MMAEDVIMGRFGFLIFMFRLGDIPLFYHTVTITYSVYRTIFIVCSYSMFLAMLMECILYFDDIERISQPFTALIPMICCIWSHIYLRLRQDKLENLFHRTVSFSWDELPTRNPQTGYLTAAGMIPFITKFLKSLIGVLVFFHTAETTIHMVVSEERVLGFRAWYYINTSQSPIYELINISQVFGVQMYLSFFYGLGGLYATFVSIASGQLEKVRKNLMEINMNAIISENNIEMNGEKNESDEVFSIMQKKIRECILLHQETLRFMWAIEEIFSPLLVVNLLFLLASLCFTAFSAVTIWGNVLQLSQTFVLYFVTLLQVLAFCWFGSALTEQAERVRDAAWCCDWVGAPISFQRCLIFIIAAANKPFIITAGKILPVSKITMVNMIKESISFFMFLLQMKEVKETVAA